MSPDKKRDKATLDDLIAACVKVLDFVQGASRADLDHNEQLLSACCYQIAVMGEAVKRLSATMRAQHPHVPWKDIAGMRGRLIHAYDTVDAEELWKTATEDVPALLVQVRIIRAAE